MKKQRVFALIVVALVTLPLAAGFVVARATNPAFSALMCRVTVDDAGYEWDVGKTHHHRANKTTWDVYSEEPLVAGTMHRVMNINSLLATKAGPFWGTFSLEPTDYQGSSWEGTYSGYRYEDGVMYSRWEGHGTEELEGLKIKFTVEKPVGVIPNCPNYIPMSGNILDPHGVLE